MGEGRLRRLGLLLAAAGLGALVAPSISARAATPDQATLAAPATQGAVSVTWHGTAGPNVSTGPTGSGIRCHDAILAAPSSPGLDTFKLNLTGVSGAFYTAHSAVLKIRIDWTPAVNANANSLQLTTMYDDGSGTRAADKYRDGAPRNDVYQEVTYQNPDPAVTPGHINVFVCGARNLTSQDYTGTATLRVTPLTVSDTTVTTTHKVNYSFPPVQGTYQNVSPGSGVSTVDNAGTCPPNTCAAMNLLVQYPSPRAVFLQDHRTHLKIHYTWQGSGQDLDVRTVDPYGRSGGPGTPDASNPTAGYEDLDITNPGEGTWAVYSTAGTVSTPTPATMEATLATQDIPGPRPDPALAPGSPTFTNYDFPDTAPWNTAGSNEPSLGVDTKTGKVLYQDNLYTARITFDDKKSPAGAKFEDVSPLTSVTSLDPLLFHDPVVNRTVVSQLYGACSLSSFSDDDGASWTPSQGCSTPAGPDHQTIGSGPYPANQVAPHTFDRAFYYCSQGIAAAFCAQSRDGAQTYGPPVAIYNTSQCTGLHGHVKVANDGTVYVPNKNCGNGTKAAVVSEDGGNTWSVRPIPESADPEVASTAGTPAATSSYGHDPAIAIAPDDGTVYEAWMGQSGEFKSGNWDATGGPQVAVSRDHGKTWSGTRKVGQEYGLKNADFPEIVAGTGGRAAYAFLASKSPGVAYEPDFFGTWYMYVAFTDDYGRTWKTYNATPNDPVQRGCVWYAGGSNACRNMLDFNDITLDTSGRVLVAYTDGCTGACVKDPAQTPYGSVAAIVRQNVGPSIIAACGTTFQPGCATPTLQGRLVSGTIPDTSAAAPAGVLPLGAAALAFGTWTASRRRRRRRQA